MHPATQMWAYCSEKQYTNKNKIQSRRQCGKTQHASLHNHIKITTKLYNNHHLEQSEIKLNGNLTTMGLKKPQPFRLLEGAETWKTWTHIRAVNSDLSIRMAGLSSCFTTS